MSGSPVERQTVEGSRPVDFGMVEAVRQFNRFYTRQLGLLTRDFLGSKWTLTEVRVLYELATLSGVTAAEIANELRLDVAYLSRLLAKFQRRGLLTRTTSRDDARRQHLTLTPKGRSAFAPLDQSAKHQIAAMLAPLTPAAQHALVAAMVHVQRALQPARDTEACQVRPLKIGDIGWITHRQGILYAQEYGWDITYEALVAEILSDFLKNFDSRRDAAWVAERAGSIVGSVFLIRESATVAKLRLLYVEPSTRGSGIGRNLVTECIRGARDRGYQTLRLWTNDVLASARRIYETAGFKLISEEPHRSFGQELVGQIWELPLGKTWRDRP